MVNQAVKGCGRQKNELGTNLKSNPHPYVTAIIINYKTADYAVHCVHSLLQQKAVRLQIIVVDNASGDGGVHKLHSAYPTEILLIENFENLGFAKANNLAAKYAEGDYYLIINPDLKFTKNDDLANLVAEMNHLDQAGVIGPRIMEPRRNRKVGPKFSYSEQRYLKATQSIHQLPGEIAWLLGACLLFPAEVYRGIGGFDEDFFLYGEDADICLRVRKSGRIVAWTDQVTAEHWGGASETSALSYDKWRRKKRGYYQFCLKHYDASDVTHILRRNALRTRIKLFGLKGRYYLPWGKRTSLSSDIERVRAENDVLWELLKSQPQTKV